MSKGRFEQLATRKAWLQTQAAIERAELLQHAAGARRALQPASWLRQIVPSLALNSNSLLVVWRLLRRYPMLASAGPAWLLSGGSRFGKLLKLGAGALVGWRLLRRNRND